jgi:transitional endoplasmic reticulum ATPase
VDRAADEVAAFEAHGGDPARARLLRARIMATRLSSESAQELAPSATEKPERPGL